MRATPYGSPCFHSWTSYYLQGGVSPWHSRTPHPSRLPPIGGEPATAREEHETYGTAVPSSPSSPRPRSLGARPRTGCASPAPTQSCVNGNEPRAYIDAGKWTDTHHDTGRISTTRYSPVSEDTLYIYGAGAPIMILSKVS